MKQRALALLLALMMVVTMFSGCADKDAADSSGDKEPVTDTDGEKQEDASKEEEPLEPAAPTSTKVENLFDPNFSIEKLENGVKKVIDGEGRELILVPKTMSEVPAEYAGSIVIRTPVDNAVFLSSTQVCSFRAVNDETIIDAIGGVSGDLNTWKEIAPIAEAMEAGKIVDVGGGMGDPDYELIQSLEPDVIFVYTGTSPQSSQIAKFEELGINYAVDNEYMETNYLARMEWMRFILTFFDADEKVDEVLNNAKANVDAVKAKLEGMEKPKVAVFSVFDGAVYATADESWVGTMLADMGGVNVFSGMPAGTLTIEAAFDAMQDADVIVYTSTPTWCAGMPAILEAFPMLKDCKAYENDKVFQYGEPFWMGIDKTDEMAADLAAVLYPEAFPERETTFYVHAEK